MDDREETKARLPIIPTDGVWFLWEPAEPPFPCSPASVPFWLSMERQMWVLFIERAVTDQVEPLFPDG